MRLLLRLLPVLLAVGWVVVAWHLSAGRLAARLRAQSVPLNDPGLAPGLARLAAALGVDHIAVRVQPAPQVNGLAAPDGSIYLTEGFVHLYRQGAVSADELMSVIAHEIGHVAHGHARRRMIDATGGQAVQGVLGLALGRLVPVAGARLVPGLAQMVTRGLRAHLGRGAEFEADAYATALLIKAGIGAAPQISLFEKLDRLTGPGPRPAATTDWPGIDWLASHPTTEARISRIRANVAKWGG